MKVTHKISRLRLKDCIGAIYSSNLAKTESCSPILHKERQLCLHSFEKLANSHLNVKILKMTESFYILKLGGFGSIYVLRTLFT